MGDGKGQSGQVTRKEEGRENRERRNWDAGTARAWSPVRREKEAGRRENQDRGGQTDVETRAARAMAEARQAGMEERSREKQDRGTVGQRDPNCAGHGLGLGPWVEEGRRQTGTQGQRDTRKPGWCVSVGCGLGLGPR